ncbi:multidrug MFS transporter [Parafrankia colletiae]|uniref:Multidrug MFS transporter n=1 Tax=Parafrankia colletiae TaxID=573497 RepID=A0A1S1QEM0_9ACTN|nr:MFS transporter [Parafrankia colletiae]MCK9901984.1 DHA2 family efflux MFS transporter permease subunit [Frankia sp. Cpl3]OHV33238.1 multidrug MFS transporter [Parafrankia colletiae]
MERRWWTLVAVLASTFMLLLDITIVVVALPDIQQELNTSFSDLQWVVDAYALTLAALLLTSGSLADRYGRRLLFLIGLGTFTAGSALCAAAQTPLMLIGSRALQGVGGAILFSTSLALLAMNFHGRERGIAFGAWGAVAGVSTALGPILGGLITSGVSWRGIFWVNLPVGVAAIAITLRKVGESRAPHAHRPDLAGFATLTSGLVALVYGLIRASADGWGDAGVIICLVLAAVLLVAFAVAETRVAHPMFDLSLLRIPTFLGGSVAAFAMNGSLYAMLLYLTVYLQNDLGYSALGAGLRMVVLSATAMVVSAAAGRLSTVVPVRWLIGPGLALVGAGLLLMAGLDAGSDWTHLIPGLVVAGAGSGLVNPPLASTAVGVVHPFRSGMASGVNTTFRQVGIAVGTAVYGSIFTARLAHGLDDRLAGVPALAGQANQIADAVHGGGAGQVIGAAPAAARPVLTDAIHASFAGALNELLITAGILAILGGTLALVLIRGKDFAAVPQQAPRTGAGPTGATPTGATPPGTPPAQAPTGDQTPPAPAQPPAEGKEPLPQDG